MADTATVIITGNKFNKQIYSAFRIGSAFGHSMQIGRPADMAKPTE
jgi:hypothetical protein